MGEDSRVCRLVVQPTLYERCMERGADLGMSASEYVGLCLAVTEFFPVEMLASLLRGDFPAMFGGGTDAVE